MIWKIWKARISIYAFYCRRLIIGLIELYNEITNLEYAVMIWINNISNKWCTIYDKWWTKKIEYNIFVNMCLGFFILMILHMFPFTQLFFLQMFAVIESKKYILFQINLCLSICNELFVISCFINKVIYF